MKKTMEKINKTKSWFFENLNKIDKPLAKLRKREKTQVNKTRDITTNTAEIQKIISGYYEQVYAINGKI